MALRDYLEAIRAPFSKRGGLDTNISRVDYAKDNGFVDYCRNAANTGILPLWGSDSDNAIQLAGSVVTGQRMVKSFKLATNASITTQAFWIADGNYTITNISCIFDVADGAANTAYIGKATSTQAPSAAVTLMSGTFNMNATARTVQTATLTSNWNVPTQASIQLSAGDRLVFSLASAVTSLAGVCITVTMTPGNKSLTAEYVMNANGDLIAASTFFLSNGEYVVTGVRAIWSAAGTNGGTVTYDVTKDTSTNAAGAGTSVLLAAVSVKTTANTVSTPSLATSAATLRLTQSDRLAVKLTGTLTTLAGLVVVVSLRPIQQCIEIGFNLAKNANLAVDTDFFIADRTYEFVCASLTYATTNAGALTCNLVRDTGTTAAGGGTSLQSGTFNLNTTANTPLFATLLGVQSNYLLQGDRLGLHYSTTVTNLAGLCLAVKLIPR